MHESSALVAQWRSKPSEVISRIGDEAAALLTRTPGSISSR
jgi:hypothetical protein